MITEYRNDIFLAPTNIIIHQCNCFCTMGSGIAKTIKERFPEVYETDCKTTRGDISKLGSFNFTKVNAEDNPKLKYICNFYGQFKYGRDKRYTSYDAVTEAFSAINEAASSRAKIPVLAVPYKMGCNNAGGSWRIVETILHDIFDESPVNLLICRHP
jgi:O-acetyl-ADP-ribose deacetylase (regulator of RNase III)